MSLTKRVGYGNSLAVDITGGSSFVNVASIVGGFSGPDAKTKDANTSLLSDWFETFAPTSVDPGSLTFTIAYDPADAVTSQKLATLLSNGNVANWQITYSGSGTPPTETFLAFVSGMGREVKKENMVTCNVTLKLSGTPGYTL